MDSKIHLISSNHSSPKFQLKRKHSPITFNQNGDFGSKRINLSSDINNNNTNNKNKFNIQEQRRRLPIFEQRNKLLDLIRRHSTLIILGETGSGKTTQLPQYIYSARLQENGKIAITQPRRVAAVSVAMRVAQEVGQGEVGEVVGFSVRFENVTSDKTKIKFLTDGMLLREAIADSMLMDYTVIILDEAHERTIHTDVLFGIVKQAQKLRQDKKLKLLKVLIMSATMDVDHFSEYFNNCQAVYLEGRTYPVNIYYTKVMHEDYQSACVATFFKIHREAPANHDVLIFLTGQEEIEAVSHQIRILARDPDVDGPNIKVCPLYAAQPSNQQMAVFQPASENVRKVIVATNVAETSITISGIKYVIDSGMVKARTYHPTTGLEMLKVQRISQEQSWQRTGRAGRDSEGYCYRIYTRAQFERILKTSVPEIQRANLTMVAIQLLALGIHALHFDFMDKPRRDTVLDAFEQLILLGAIENSESKILTSLGKQMAHFPLDPKFSKILLTAHEFGCLEEALTIVAILSGESIFLNPPSKREQALICRQKFISPYGDHITLLNTYREFNNISMKNQRSWCHEHYINLRNILYAQQIRKQLLEVCIRYNLPVHTCGNKLDQIRKCLMTGLFMNIAQLHKDRQYITLDKKQVVSIHPSSVLHGQQPNFIIFTEVIQTNKCYLRNLTTVEGTWLDVIVPDYVKMHNIKCN